MTQKQRILAALAPHPQTVKQLQTTLGISQPGTVRRELMELRRLGAVVKLTGGLWAPVLYSPSSPALWNQIEMHHARQLGLPLA